MLKVLLLTLADMFVLLTIIPVSAGAANEITACGTKSAVSRSRQAKGCFHPNPVTKLPRKQPTRPGKTLPLSFSHDSEEAA